MSLSYKLSSSCVIGRFLFIQFSEYSSEIFIPRWHRCNLIKNAVTFYNFQYKSQIAHLLFSVTLVRRRPYRFLLDVDFFLTFTARFNSKDDSLLASFRQMTTDDADHGKGGIVKQ